MATHHPRISVIVPAYQPGDAILNVIDSLDAQTLPQDQFETIIVDDGSTDDTYARLVGFAATRPNLRVLHIENSGWPSRPRNVGTLEATAPYVFYMDADDALFPDALRRLADYAEETAADVISPKESKSSDLWWAMPAMAAGNAADVKADHQINRLLPMGPTKVYRRDFLLEQGVRFPEGRRALWEDIFFNVEAYAKAAKVAVLADTPAYLYLWHKSDSHISTSYAAIDTEYWDRLDALVAFIDDALGAESLAEERRSMIMHQYQGRVLRRLGRALQSANPQEAAVAVSRAQALQDAYVPPDWDSRLGFFTQPLARFLREGRADLIRDLHATYIDISARTELTSVAWDDGKLAIEADTVWRHSDGDPVVFERTHGRIRMRVPSQIAEALPPEALDVTDRLDSFTVWVGVRARAEQVTWQLPATPRVSVDPHLNGVVLRAHVSAQLDPLTVAGGRPLDPTLWDFSSSARWGGIARATPIRARIDPKAALVCGLPAVAHSSQGGKLSLDLGSRLRSTAADGLQPGPAIVSSQGFTLQLPKVTVYGETDAPVEVLAVPTGRRGSHHELPALPARIIGDADGARIEARGSLPKGSSRLAFRSEAGTIETDYVAVQGVHGLRIRARLRPVRFHFARLRRLVGATRRKLGRR